MSVCLSAGFISATNEWILMKFDLRVYIETYGYLILIQVSPI